ncbi:sigma-70 family RNA polymerase sigma factor [Acrocarpospora corrugata]|nr:sigma-70 family RNA polymerase sigma factor [Acrocarpospora corrugata]
MVGSYDDSEDLAQDTFLRAWRNRDGFQRRSSFRAWLYRIATNTCLDFLRRNTRRPQRYEGEQLGAEPLLPGSPGSSPARWTGDSGCDLARPDAVDQDHLGLVIEVK